MLMLVFSTSSLCSVKSPQANNLVILYLNIRSIRNKFDEFLVFLERAPRKPDLIALSETWLKSSDCLNLYKIPGYHPIITHNRDSKLGGGVAIYVKKDFEYDKVENHASMEILKLRTKGITFVVFNRPPNTVGMLTTV